MLEEAFHARAAQTVAETGYPLVYYGEQQPPTIYLDRPPGLLLLTAASFKLFGQSEISARLVPLTLFLATLVLTYYFAIRLFPNRKPAILFAILLLAIHPYMIQSSLMLHFDGALVPFFTATYLFLALSKITKRINTWTSHIQLAAIIYFSLWVKYEPTILIIAIGAVAALIYYKPFLRKLLISSLAATIVFAISFFLYNFIMGYPEGFWLPFIRIIQLSQGSFLAKLNIFDQSLRLWAGSYYIAIRFLSWLSIPTILLSIYAAVRLLQEKTLRTDPKIIFLVAWILVFTATYIIAGWAGDYPRYFAPAIPPLFLLIALTTEKSLKKIRFNPQKIFIIFILSLFFVFLLKINGYLFLDHITGWIPHLQIPFFMIIFFGAVALLIIKRSPQRVASFLIFLIFFQIAQIAAQYWHDVNAKYSLTNFYGNGLYKPVAELLKQNLPPDATILTFDPIGYYWGGTYYDYYQMGYHRINDPEIFKEAFLNDKIAAIALPREYIFEYAANIKKTGFDLNKYLANNYKNKRNFGGEKGIAVWF